MSILRIPPELLLEVAGFLDKKDLHSLGSCHSAIRLKLIPRIFEKVFIVIHPKISKYPGPHDRRQVSLKADWFDAQVHQPLLPEHIRCHVKALSIESSPDFLIGYRQMKFRDLPVDQFMDAFPKLQKLYFTVANPPMEKTRYLCSSSFDPRSKTVSSVFSKLSKRCSSRDKNPVEFHASMVSGHLQPEALESMSNFTSLTLRSANSGWFDYGSPYWLSNALNASAGITSLDLGSQADAGVIPYVIDLDQLLDNTDVELNTLKRLRVNSIDLHVKPENFWKIKNIEELDFTLEPDRAFNSAIRRNKHPWKGSKPIWECLIGQRTHLKKIRYHTAHCEEFAWSSFMFYCNFVNASEVRQLDLSFGFVDWDRSGNNPTFEHLSRLFVENMLPRFNRLECGGKGPSYVREAINQWLDISEF